MTRKRTALTGSLDISLQPKQKVAWDYINGGQYTWIGLGGSKGGGKAAPLHSKVMTPFGESTMGEMEIGSQVSCPDGTVARVIQTWDRGVMPVFRLTFSDGASCLAAGDHLWLARKTVNAVKADRRYFPFEEADRTVFKLFTTEMLSNEVGRTQNAIHVPLTQPVSFTRSFRGEGRSVPPYVLGVLLGDGTFRNNTLTFCSGDAEIPSRVSSALRIDLVRGAKMGTDAFNYSIPAASGVPAKIWAMGLRGKGSADKFIPEPYVLSSEEDRLELLRGLMDTDGYVDSRGHASFTSASKRMAEQVQWIGRSLGYKASLTSGPSGYRKPDGEYVECLESHTVYFGGKNASDLFHLKRKKDRCCEPWSTGRRVKSIEPAGEEVVKCITIDHPAGLYMTDDFIVTHNSGGARRILLPLLFAHPGTAALLVRKTYKEVVMNHVEKIILEFPQLAQFYNKSDQMFRIPLAKGMTSRLYIGYGENEGDVRRYNGTDDFAWVFVDQAEEFPEGDINTLRTCLRSTIPNVNPAMILSFNPGGLSHQFLKRIFKDRKFKEGIENPDQYAPMIEARGWDNVEWVRTELERDGFTVDDYYYEWDEEKRREYFLQSAYGKNLLANPDKTLREWYLWGNWDTYAGQYFDQFDRDVHTYIPGMVTIEPEWYKWISCDIGFQHKAVIQWHAYDGEVIYTYREFAQARMEAKDLADVIVEKSRNETIGAFYLSHDAFGKRDSVKTRAMEIAEIMLQNGLPTPVAPDLDRVGGWRLMNYLLVSGGWKISKDCVDLIQTIPGAVRNPRDPEDVLKFDGDDALDTARYGLKTYQRSPRGNREKLIEAAVKSSDPTIQYLQRAMAEAKLKNGFTRPISLAARPRRGSSWRWGAAGGVR